MTYRARCTGRRVSQARTRLSRERRRYRRLEESLIEASNRVARSCAPLVSTDLGYDETTGLVVGLNGDHIVWAMPREDYEKLTAHFSANPSAQSSAAQSSAAQSSAETNET